VASVLAKVDLPMPVLVPFRLMLLCGTCGMCQCTSYYPSKDVLKGRNLSASPEGEARLPMPKGMAYKE
jgi:hypothetical protein